MRTKERGIEHWVVIYGIGESPKRVFIAGNGFFKGTEYSWSKFSASMWTPRGEGLVCWGRQ